MIIRYNFVGKKILTIPIRQQKNNMNRLFLLLLTAFMLSACTGDTQKKRELIYRAVKDEQKRAAALYITEPTYH